MLTVTTSHNDTDNIQQHLILVAFLLAPLIVVGLVIVFPILVLKFINRNGEPEFKLLNESEDEENIFDLEDVTPDSH